LILKIEGGATAQGAAKHNTTRALPKAVRYILQGWAGDTVKHVKEGLAGRYLNRRSGHLANAVGKRLDRSGEVTTAYLGTNVAGKVKDVPYAKIQDEGGTIVPRRARALAVPIPPTKGLPRNFPNLTMIRRVGKPPLLVEITPKGAWKIRFVLLQSVTLKPSRWWSNPWDEMKAVLRRRMDDDQVLAVAEKLSRAGAGPEEA
jgi:hypothetical protein